jgi:hypothetical protein
MASAVGNRPVISREAVILSIQTDAAGRCVLSSSDGCMGGTFLNRHAALREVDDRICRSDRVTVIVIEPENRKLTSTIHRTF